MEMNKPREFKLIVEDWNTKALSWDEDNLNEITTGEVIHVIEYSAVEKLKRIVGLGLGALMGVQCSPKNFNLEGLEQVILEMNTALKEN